MAEMSSKAVCPLNLILPPQDTLMYSPKIREDLIPILYRLAKKQGQSMTAVVDAILREKLSELEIQEQPEERGC